MPRFLLQQDAVFSRVVDAPDLTAAARFGQQSDPIADTWEREWSGLEITPIDESGQPLYDQTQSAEELVPGDAPNPQPPPAPEENTDAPQLPPPPVEL